MKWGLSTCSGPAGGESPNANIKGCITWDTLIDKLENPQEGVKDGSYFIRGVLKGHRCDKNLKWVTAVVVDGDMAVNGHKMPLPEEVHDALKGEDITHIIYSSFSNTKEHPKYRVIIPSIYEVSEDQKEKVNATTAEIHSILHKHGLMIANVSESSTMSQAWYMPRVTDESKEHYYCAHYMGENKSYKFRNEELLPTAAKAEKETLAVTTGGSAAEWTKGVMSGEVVHTSLRSLAARHMAIGMTVESSIITLQELMKIAKIQWEADDNTKRLKEWGHRFGQIEKLVHSAYKKDFQNSKPASKPLDKNFFRSPSEILLASRPTNWLIDHHVPGGNMGIVYGPSDTCKTFMVMDMGMSIAHGIPWHGSETKQGVVLLVCGEGNDGIGRRQQAWHQHHGLSLIGAPFYVSVHSVKLFHSERVEELVVDIDYLCQTNNITPDLIIIDTLSKNNGGSENSNSDMAKFYEHAESLGGAECTKIVVHHTGHDGNETRGASNLMGDYDFRYKTDRKKDAETISLTCKKMKDASKPDEHYFTTEQVQIDLSCLGLPQDQLKIVEKNMEDEHDLTSLVLNSVADALAAEFDGEPDTRQPMSPSERGYYNALRVAAMGAAISRKDWSDEVIATIEDEGGEVPTRQGIAKIQNKLVAKGWVSREGDLKSARFRAAK